MTKEQFLRETLEHVKLLFASVQREFNFSDFYSLPIHLRNVLRDFSDLEFSLNQSIFISHAESEKNCVVTE